MDRPSPAGTPPEAPHGSPPRRAEPPTVPAGRRWARILFWLLVAALIAVGAGSRVLDTLPLPPAHVEVAPSVLLDRHGVEFAEIGPPVAHASLGLEDMAPALVDAVVAVLDPQFLSDQGVDATSYSDALRLREIAADAGTDNRIMRRYLNTVHLEDSNVAAQARLLLAELRLARQLSRPEILERFLNVVYLGRGAYGVHAAADAWYGIPASDLSVAQAAYLASLVDAPWGIDAAVDGGDAQRSEARLRRDRALLAMYDNGALTEDELAKERAVPVLAGIRPAAEVGIGAESQRNEVPDAASGGFIRLLVDDAGLEPAAASAYLQLVERYGVHRLVTGGLVVTTTIDLKAQQAAFGTALRLGGDAAMAASGSSAEAAGAAEASFEADVIVLDRSGDVRVLLRLNTTDAPASERQRRPFGDLGGSASSVLESLLGSDPSVDVAGPTADVAEIAAAFGVIAAGGSDRPSRIVLNAVAAPGLSPGDGDLERWPMAPRPVLGASAVEQMREEMVEHTLDSGVTVWGRAAAVPQTGDGWYAGWTSHYTAAVRVNLGGSPQAAAAAASARALLNSVLTPLQYGPR